MQLRNFLSCLLLAAALSGCGEEQTRPPTVRLTVVNASPGFGSLALRRGSTSAADLGQASFPGVLGAGIDADTYNFSVVTPDSITGTFLPRVEFTETLAAGERHLFVLAEQNATVVPFTVSMVPIDPGSANMDVLIFHAVQNLASADVYIAPPGADITAATPAATLQFGQSTRTANMQPGEYVFTITEAGNAANVLYTSTTANIPAGVSAQLIVVPDANGRDDILSAVLNSTASFTLTDVNAAEYMRIINGAADLQPRDYYVNGDFSAPFAANVAFGTATDYLELPPVATVIEVTPAGDVSVIEAEITGAVQSGRTYNLLASGPAGDLDSTASEDNLRPNNDYPRFLLMNMVNYYEGLDVYLVDPGTDLAGVLPTWTVTSPVITQRVVFPDGPFDFIVRDGITDAVVLGPLAMTLDSGGVYTVVLHDSGDGTTVNALLLDDFE